MGYRYDTNIQHQVISGPLIPVHNSFGTTVSPPGSNIALVKAPKMGHVILTLGVTFSPALLSTCAKGIKAAKAFQHKHVLVTSGESLCKGVSMEKKGSSEAQRRRPKRTDYKPTRGLITIRRSDGNWTDSWTCQHMTSLKALGLEDLAAEDCKTKDDVIVNLSIQKHAGVGYSVDGTVISSIIRRCRFCCTEYCNQIESSFDAWCLSTNNSLSQFQTAAEVNDDPFVIYFSRGREEANLDDVVRDTIRLNCSIEATCSDVCKKSEVRKWECACQICPFFPMVFGISSLLSHHNYLCHCLAGDLKSVVLTYIFEVDDAKRATVDKRWLPILKARII